jgi:hypothetical protein
MGRRQWWWWWGGWTGEPHRQALMIPASLRRQIWELTLKQRSHGMCPEQAICAGVLGVGGGKASGLAKGSDHKGLRARRLSATASTAPHDTG